MLGCCMNTRWAHLLSFSLSCSLSIVLVSQMLWEWDLPSVCQDCLQEKKPFSVSLQSLCDVRTSQFSKSEDYFCFDADFLKWQSFVTNLQFMLEQPLHSGLVNLDLNFRFCRCSLDSFCVLSRAASESCTPNYFLSEEGRGHQGTSYVQRSRLCHF